MAAPDRILTVDLYGVAVVLEEFGRVIAPGEAGIVISPDSAAERAHRPAAHRGADGQTTTVPAGS